MTARLDLAKKLDETLYTAASWEVLQKTVADAQQLVDASSSDIKAVNAAYDAITSAIYSLRWADSVEFKTFEHAPEFVYGSEYSSAFFADKNVKETFVENGTEWESDLDGSQYRMILGGVAVVNFTSKNNWFYSALVNLSVDETSAALLAQGETLVVETSDDFGATIKSRYIAYLAVNDGLDRTALHTAVATAFTLDESDYTASSWKTMQTALTQARKVYADKASTQEQIDAAAKALSEAVANKSGSDTPVGEIKDIGLTYGGYGAFSILGEPGEYSDAYFQIVAGEYVTNLTDMCGYNTNDWMSNGYANAQNPDKMWEYIKANCKKGDKYVVTIKLYHYDKDTKEFTPYLVDGKQVEFLVYVTE